MTIQALGKQGKETTEGETLDLIQGRIKDSKRGTKGATEPACTTNGCRLEEIYRKRLKGNKWIKWNREKIGWRKQN